VARLHLVVDAPASRYDDLTGFWEQVLGWPAGEGWPGHPELRSFEPPQGSAYVHLQRVQGAPGVHLDVGSADPGATTARAQELGADLVAESDRWRTLRSPGGLPFCTVGPGLEEIPPPVTWPAGHRTRLVQVCVDSPADVHDDEVAFWRGLLGDRWFSSSSPEFAGKWHDDGSPLQLLFQRIEEDTGPVRAHLDLGTDDLAAEVDRLSRLGATDVAPGRGWHVLRDPAGMVFCVTENSPEQTVRRDLG
jgi:hypothetical protein